jgi:hypothetical protein
MPAFTRPYRLILSFWRGEAEIIRRLAKDGEDAAMLAAALLYEAGELEHGPSDGHRSRRRGRHARGVAQLTLQLGRHAPYGGRG